MQEVNIQQQLTNTNQEFRNLFSSIPVEQVNTVPYEGSWTPAQVAQHVLKSEVGMLRALQAPAQEAGRDAYSGVPRLKAIFLDFTTKLKSPEMAVPEEREYDKDQLLQQLDGIAAKLTEAIPNINDKELVTGLPAGDLTKGEIIYFLLYHTKRHIHQLQKIMQALTNKTKPVAVKDKIIQQVNDAFSKNDVDAFLSYCTDDVSWDIIGDSATAGKENIREMMTSVHCELPQTSISHIFSGENNGTCTGVFSIKKTSGETGHYHFCDVYHFSDDKIQRMESYIVEMKKFDAAASTSL